MVLRNVILTLTIAVLAKGQRPSFAGTRPIGYPEIIKPSAAPAADASGLVNRVGEDDVSTTTIRLPIEALGDRDLVDRISKLPKDQQPFWYLNWQALEANRNNPQTFEQRPSQFAQPLHPVTNNQNVDTRAESNSNSGTSGFSLPTSTSATGANFNVPSSNPVQSTLFVNQNIRPTNAPSNGNTFPVTAQTQNQPSNFQSRPPLITPTFNRPTNTAFNPASNVNSFNANPQNLNNNQNAAIVSNQNSGSAVVPSSSSQISDPNKGLPSSGELASILGNRFGDDDVYVPSQQGYKNPEHGLQSNHHLDKVIFDDGEDVGIYGLGPDEYDFKYSRNLRQIDDDYFYKI